MSLPLCSHWVFGVTIGMWIYVVIPKEIFQKLEKMVEYFYFKAKINIGKINHVKSTSELIIFTKIIMDIGTMHIYF